MLNFPYLLLAEDDPDLRALLANALRQAGYKVVECAHGVELLQELDGTINGHPEEGLRGVITDVRMPGVTGISVLEGLHSLGVSVPVILITAFGSPTLHQQAAEWGAKRTFDKPFDIENLVDEVVRSVGSP